MYDKQGSGTGARQRRKDSLLFLLVFVLVGCNFAARAPTPTPTQSVTQAFQTVQARLTEAIAQTPQVTSTTVPTESGLEPPTPSPSPSPTSVPEQTTTATAICDLAAAGNPIDVTIPDDTVLKPGESFTKIWSVRNIGSCTWTIQYAAVWFSGEMMGAPSSTLLTDIVLPGESVEISVDMIAPVSPGTFQSNWKLRNPAGQLFGIGPGGNSPFWVRIEVAPQPSDTPSPSPEPTVTEEPAPTPDVLVSGSAPMNPGDTLDLDSNLVNGAGADLNYQADGQGMLFLIPLPGVTLGFWGPATPDLQDCQTTNLSTGQLPVDSLAPGAHLCYQTDQGNFGWIRLIDRTPDDTLTLEILTWAPGQTRAARLP